VRQNVTLTSFLTPLRLLACVESCFPFDFVDAASRSSSLLSARFPLWMLLFVFVSRKGHLRQSLALAVPGYSH